MKYVWIALLVLPSLQGFARQQDLVDKYKTVIDFRKARYLDSLMAVIGNKRIVALGEDTHGTAEFYELRAAITRKLIKEKGFSVVILENPHEDMIALQQGLQTTPLDTLMRRHLFSIYQTQQMRDFLAWFKKQSRRQPKLRLAGCDDSFRELLPNQLMQEAARYGNADLDSCCRDYLLRQTLPMKAYYKQYPALRPASLQDELHFGQDTYRLLERIDSLCAAQPVQYPRLKELIFHAQTSYVYYDRYLRQLPVSRDEVMGQRINYHAADSTAKIVVWAHNGHVANYAWLADELGLMGATVLKKYPQDYLSIGMSSSEGTYSYIKNRFINNDHQFTDSLFGGELHTPEAGSWNVQLAANADQHFFLDFSRWSAADLDAIRPLKKLKLMGYGKESDTEKEYYPVSLPRLFAVLIYLRKTTRTTPLFDK